MWYMKPTRELPIYIINAAWCQVSGCIAIDVGPVDHVSIHVCIGICTKTGTVAVILLSSCHWQWGQWTCSPVGNWHIPSTWWIHVKFVVVPQKSALPHNPNTARQTLFVNDWRVGQVLPASAFIWCWDGICNTETVAANNSLYAVTSPQHANTPLHVSTIWQHSSNFLLQLLQTGHCCTSCKYLSLVWSFNVQVAEEQWVIQTDTASTWTWIDIQRVVPRKHISNNCRCVDVFIQTVIFRQTHTFWFAVAYHLRSHCWISVIWCTMTKSGILLTKIVGVWKQQSATGAWMKQFFPTRWIFCGLHWAHMATILTKDGETGWLCMNRPITIWQKWFVTVKRYAVLCPTNWKRFTPLTGGWLWSTPKFSSPTVKNDLCKVCGRPTVWNCSITSCTGNSSTCHIAVSVFLQYILRK